MDWVLRCRAKQGAHAKTNRTGGTTMRQNRRVGWLTLLGVAAIVVSGCQRWVGRRPANEVGVDTELTSQPPVEVPSPAKPQEPRPAFEQEPKQAP